MARRIATANGNFTAAATWGLVDTTSFLELETGITNFTTAYVESATFTPGAITIDGIALKLAFRAVTPSGTVSVRLAQAGATVAGTEVTINVSDLPAFNQGWTFFKFAAPVLLVAATLYTVSAKASVISQVGCQRSTAGNWNRMLRTTTTGAPAAGDDLFILGEWTAAATKTDRTVTMDSTAATDYGGASTTLTAFGISKGGILTWGSTAATNYILRLSGILTIWADGLMNMGTVATPCPRDSTMLLEFDCAVDGDFGLQIYGQLVAQGLSRTAGKNVVQCLLNTDEAAGQTVLGVDTDTGWLSGDEIAIASTTQTGSQGEERVLNGAAAASTVTVSVALTNAHSGTSPTQAEVVLLTRNVRIRAVTSTLVGYVQSGTLAVVDMDWVELRYMGITAAKPTLQIACDTNGSWAMNFCAFRDSEGGGIVTLGSAWGNLTIEDCVTWRVGHNSTAFPTIDLIATTLGNWEIRRCTLLNNLTNGGYSLRLATLNGDIEDLRIGGGGGEGIELALSSLSAAAQTVQPLTRTFDGIVIHSMGNYGIRSSAAGRARLSDTTLWRNADGGLAMLAGFRTDLAFDDFDWFGNGVAQIVVNASGLGVRMVRFRNGTFAGDSSFATPRGLAHASGFESQWGPFIFENVTFGVVSGIRVAHSSADLDFGTTSFHSSEIVLNNVLLASGTPIANQSSLDGGVIRYQRVQQVLGVHKAVYPSSGTVSLDTVLFRTATPSMKLEPTAANIRLESGPAKKPAALGATVAISVYVQKNVAYAGNAPRLMLRANPSLGVDDDTVIATHSALAGVWQQLSGTTPAAEDAGAFEFYVDCDGTAGQVNVDDWE